MKKTWGFGVPGGPLQFSTRGARETARALIKLNEVVVIVGTQDLPTPEHQQGNLLGLVEPTTFPVASLDYYLDRHDHDYDEQGNYRWPYGLELRAAWRFVEPLTSLSDISGRDFGRQGVLGITAMTPDEEAAILALPREQIGLLQPLRAQARISGESVARKRAAPPPTTIRTGVMHMRRMSAFTYAMALERGGLSAFKIGWAFDYKVRQRQFNAAALPELGGIRYAVKRFQLWDTAMEAFRMEQWLLQQFDALRHPANREVITPLTVDALQSAWTEYLLARIRPVQK